MSEEIEIQEPIATTPEADKKRRQKKDLNREQELADLSAVLKTGPGQRFFQRLIERSGFFREPRRDNSNDTHFDLGRISYLKPILSDAFQAEPAITSQLMFFSVRKDVGGVSGKTDS